MSEEEKVNAELEALAEKIEIEINALQVLREQMDELGKKLDAFQNKIENGEFDV